MIGAPGILIAAPASHSGKTTVTLGLLRHFARRGVRVASFKAGPDYIDPAFHAAATGRACLNLDPWAMRRSTIAALSMGLGTSADIVLGEGVMGLFDAAADGTGSTADLAALTGWPVVLVIDVRGQGDSAAALVHGFATFRSDIRIAGVVFNRVGGDRHKAILERAMDGLDIPVLGHVRRRDDLVLPERHLGLVQAGEHGELDAFLNRAADAMAEDIDSNALRRLATPGRLRSAGGERLDLPVPGQRIAVAMDEAFAFVYPHLLGAWHEAGAAITAFSPLADEAPNADADAIYLPGGYPELHAGKLAANESFLGGLRAVAEREAVIYGECGGFMVLGDALTDADGVTHRMAGLLPLETSFAERRLHLGYRRMTLAADGPFGAAGTVLSGHEFHYATTLAQGDAAPLYGHCTDAAGHDLGLSGLRRNSVSGSFLHVIDRFKNEV